MLCRLQKQPSWTSGTAKPPTCWTVPCLHSARTSQNSAAASKECQRASRLAAEHQHWQNQQHLPARGHHGVQHVGCHGRTDTRWHQGWQQQAAWQGTVLPVISTNIDSLGGGAAVDSAGVVGRLGNNNGYSWPHGLFVGVQLFFIATTC